VAPTGANSADTLEFGNTQATGYTADNDILGGISINNITVNNPNTVDFTGNQITFAGTAPQLLQNGVGDLNVGNNVHLGTSTTFGGAGSGNVYINGNVTSAAGAALTKTSAGYLVLNGANTVSGGVVIDAGTISGLGDITGDVTVNAGGYLSGERTVTGHVTVNTGGAITGDDGSGVGLLAASSAELHGGGTYAWTLLNPLGIAGTGWDLLSISGSLDFLNIDAGANRFIFDIYGTAAVGSYVVATAGSISNFDVSYFMLNDFTGGPGKWLISQSGNDILLSYIIPEPSMVMLWATGLGVFAVRHLKRRASKS
jgi:autotransporter-associated beta strand protein